MGAIFGISQNKSRSKFTLIRDTLARLYTLNRGPGNSTGNSGSEYNHEL